MKTSPSSLKVRQIVTGVRNDKIVPQPEFQRRIVWTPLDKANFIDTVLKGYPFPEIYLANGPVDVDTGDGSQLLVDGQQRVNALVEYFQGTLSCPSSNLISYQNLEHEQKEIFLNYDVAVRDLGSISNAEIIEVFKRINSTKYSLNGIEINKAVYTGEFMKLAQKISEMNFFEENSVFRPSDIKRMGDVRFILNIMITMISGYFNRDELVEEFLAKYNSEFPDKNLIESRFDNVISFFEEVGFSKKSRFWKRSDMFTAFVEVDRSIQEGKIPDPADALNRLNRLYESVDDDFDSIMDPSIQTYSKAALQASNDRLNRIRRGLVFEACLLDEDPLFALTDAGIF